MKLRLDARTLMRAAQQTTALNDYGDPTLPARFAQVVERLQTANMDAEGCDAAAKVCYQLLHSRLQFFDDHKHYSGVADEVIEKPVFVTGEPRSGTTLMHALLAQDPDARTLRFWQLMYSSPPPGVANDIASRRQKADEDWRDINRRIPKWLICHPYNDMLGDGLPECERTWAFDFRVLTPTAWWRVPMGMTIGGLPADFEAQYRIHRMTLQQGQFRLPPRRWVLKGFHGPRLKAFFETYPDARMIWMHRDPVQVIASRIAMAMALTEGLMGHAELEEQALIHLAAARASFADTMANPLVDDARIMHCRYQDFVADPITTVRQFCHFCERPFTPAAEQAMQCYLQTNRSDRHGRFHYSTELIGQDVTQLHAEFASYRERFGIDIEHRRG